MLIEDNAFVQGSLLPVLGFFLVVFAVIGLSFSISTKIQQVYSFSDKKKERLEVVLMAIFIFFLSLLNIAYSKYRENQLQVKGKIVFTRIDSVKYEERGKLAPNNYFYYSYNIDGEYFRFSYKNDRNFEAGQKIKIKYNPEKPGKHKIIGE